MGKKAEESIYNEHKMVDSISFRGKVEEKNVNIFMSEGFGEVTDLGVFALWI